MFIFSCDSTQDLPRNTLIFRRLTHLFYNYHVYSFKLFTAYVNPVYMNLVYLIKEKQLFVYLNKGVHCSKTISTFKVMFSKRGSQKNGSSQIKRSLVKVFVFIVTFNNMGFLFCF